MTVPATDGIERIERFFAQEACELNVGLAYVFGSQAEGRSGPTSDVDIAILLNQKMSASERHALTHELAELLETNRVDLIVLNQAPIELRYSVIVTGRPVYEASRSRRVQFEADTLSRYFDYLPILRRQREDLWEDRSDHDAGVQRYRTALRATERVLEQARTA